MLVVEDLRIAYGPVQAVRGIDLRVEAGQIAALLGPNGAGKSSILRALMGLAPGASGRIVLSGNEILGLPPERIAELRRRGLTILLVEQNVDRALAIADRGYVMTGGRFVLSGTAGDLVRSSGVERAHLGLVEA